MAASAEAADFTVTSLADDGGGAATTLREAVALANDVNSNDRVLFQSGLSGTITLAGSQIMIGPPGMGDLEVVGPGADVLTVSGNNALRVFYVYSDSATISGLSIVSGNAGSGPGGGIYGRMTPLTIRDSTLSGNTTSNGGIAGGGVFSDTGTLTIQDSAITGNTATGGNGGGVAQYNVSITIESSTISGNTAAGSGGGVYRASGNNGTIRSSTIAGNHAGTFGGGVRSNLNGSGPVLTNTIVADNTAPVNPDIRGDDTFSMTFSLIENPSGAPVSSTEIGSNFFNIEPGLGPLADNGGPTQTLKPAFDSPVVDKGSEPTFTSDQRGIPRPFDVPAIADSNYGNGNAADIGAVELTLAEATAPEPPEPPTPTCAGEEATIVGDGGTTTGTAGPDVIVGSSGRDLIRGLRGNDLVCARGGNDVLRGGAGRDRLLGGPGRDRLIGGPGRDRLRGGPGRDRQRQ
jgi:CSLREA domain-containing protein